jgi:hypothetical protein
MKTAIFKNLQSADYYKDTTMFVLVGRETTNKIHADGFPGLGGNWQTLKTTQASCLQVYYHCNVNTK